MCLQVLTAIELARQARIAANRAYLAGLRLGPSAMASGEVTAVLGQDALVLAAARQLAEKAALAEAKSQVGTRAWLCGHLILHLTPQDIGTFRAINSAR